MEQRPLRLGDIVDDYCTRERRVTNHVVVVLSENAIRQTRCTTCETEHPYKGGKEPRLRKKPAPTLYDQVLAGVTGEPAAATPARIAQPDDERAAAADTPPARTDDAQADTAGGDSAESSESPRTDEGWLAHRQLIRASLPKTDNEPPAPRPIPEFTMYQRPQGRSGRPFRHGYFGHPNGAGNGHGGAHGNGNGNGNVNGNRQTPPDSRSGQPSGRSGRRRRRRR